jgi:hypothetical protein
MDEKGVVVLCKAYIAGFQPPVLKPLIQDVDTIKHARPHISTHKFLYISSPNGAYDHSIL